MADVDDLIEQTGAKPAPDGTYRVRTDNLTPQERTDLEGQGYDIDGEEFVDIELEEPKPVADPNAEARAAAAEALNSVAKVGVAGPDKAPDPAAVEQEAVDSEEVQRLRNQVESLKERINSVPHLCPRCEWPVMEELQFKPTPEDVKQFLRSVMAGEVFEKSYKLFAGKAAVTFRTRTGREEALIKDVIRRLMREGVISQQVDLISYARRYNFACSVKSYVTPQKKIEFETAEEALVDDDNPLGSLQIETAIARRIEQLPSHIVVILMRLFDEFSAVVDNLSSRVEDPGFWEGIDS